MTMTHADNQANPAKRTDQGELVIQYETYLLITRGDKVLKGINLEIAKGEYVAIGRGKWCGQDHLCLFLNGIIPNV